MRTPPRGMAGLVIIPPGWAVVNGGIQAVKPGRQSSVIGRQSSPIVSFQPTAVALEAGDR